MIALPARDVLEAELHRRQMLAAAAEPEKADPLWRPLPGPQTAAYESDADELFYGGAPGGGKSDLLLGLAITAHRSSIIFRREFAQLRGAEGIIERSKQIIGQQGRLNENLFTWRGLPGGRAIEFGGCKQEDDKTKWRGRPHDLKGFDEIPEFTESQYRFLIGWLRTSVPGQRTRVVCTGNPPTTAEGQWVIKYWGPWLDEQHPRPAKPGELRYFATIDGKDVERPDGCPFEMPDGPERERLIERGATTLVRPRSRTFIPARLEDNPFLMATGYADVLDNLPEPLRSQLRHGSFTAAQSDNPWQVIPTAWVKAAQRRWRDRKSTVPPADVPLTSVGVDPSRGGEDEFVLAPRYGTWIGPLAIHAGNTVPDGNAGAKLVHRLVDGDRSIPAGIDVIGSAGASVYDQAVNLHLAAVALNGASKSTARDRSKKLGFFNKRAEWHWHMRELLDPDAGQDVALPPDSQLLADLCAPRWKPTPRGVQVEKKEDIKKRIGRSPDRGEAVIYAFVRELLVLPAGLMDVGADSSTDFSMGRDL